MARDGGDRWLPSRGRYATVHAASIPDVARISGGVRTHRPTNEALWAAPTANNLLAFRAFLEFTNTHSPGAKLTRDRCGR